MGFIAGGPTLHTTYSCYVPPVGPGKAVPQHEVNAGWKDSVAIKGKCPCRCHTPKGAREYKAELAAHKAKGSDPATATYQFEGGTSMGVNLARRVRRVPADRNRRIQLLDNKIAKLQRDRTAIIRTTWGDSDVLTPKDLAAIAAASLTPKAGPRRRDVEGRLEAKNTISPEGVAR